MAAAGTMLLLKMLHCKRRNRRKTIKNSSSEDDDGQETSRKSSLQAKVKMEVCNGLKQPHTCRICLQEGDIPIYGDKIHKDVSQYIDLFGGIKLDENDVYPKCICSSCNALLKGALLLRKTAQQSDRILREKAGNVLNSDSDVEYDINMDDKNDDDENETYKYKYKVKKEKQPEKYHCKKCCLDFETYKEYEDHRFSEEHESYRKPCPVCKKMYRATYMHKHLALHKQEYPHMCDICGKKFIIQGQFVRHRMTHFVDNLPFKCSLCPYKGRFSESLKMHMRTHTGEKPYQCPQCPTRCFVNKSNLNKHMLIHKGDHDFKCTQCQRGFYRKRDLDLHYKVDHTGIKDHVCNICGKAFGYRKQMMKHQLKVHKREKLRSGRTPLYILAESKKGGEREPLNT